MNLQIKTMFGITTDFAILYPRTILYIFQTHKYLKYSKDTALFGIQTFVSIKLVWVSFDIYAFNMYNLHEIRTFNKYTLQVKKLQVGNLWISFSW